MSRLAVRLMKPLEAASAALLTLIIVLLLTGVVARYGFALPVVWIESWVILLAIIRLRGPLEADGRPTPPR